MLANCVIYRLLTNKKYVILRQQARIEATEQARIEAALKRIQFDLFGNKQRIGW